ncbi:hypothetical protein B8V02_05615 [Streptococcus agalactiae]|nr:hypothetical protein B8V02_05615 [Streptococcus agalactiae]
MIIENPNKGDKQENLSIPEKAYKFYNKRELNIKGVSK